MITRPKIVCLCGSTRFYEEYQEANYRETLAGKIVLTVGFYGNRPEIKIHGETVGITPEQKVMLDELHMRKIDLADEILVINPGGYIGESTTNEIRHAYRQMKPIRFLVPVEIGHFARLTGQAPSQLSDDPDERHHQLMSGDY